MDREKKIIFTRRMVMTIILSGLLVIGASAQKSVKNPSADAILANVINGFDGVNDFTAAIVANLNIERVQAPQMQATMFFKKPDKVHFSSQSFLLVPREGIAMNPAVLREHFLPTNATQDTVDGKNVFKVLLAAKDTKTRIRSLMAWVDPGNWTIVKMETIPYEGRTLSMTFSYTYLEEKYWLPSKLVVSLNTDSDKGAKESSSMMEEKLDNLQRAAPRNGTVTIIYSNYKINTGLSDDIFIQKEEGKK
jgi:outer membrane lipoprotein-sorting protein